MIRPKAASAEGPATRTSISANGITAALPQVPEGPGRNPIPKKLARRTEKGASLKTALHGALGISVSTFRNRLMVLRPYFATADARS